MLRITEIQEQVTKRTLVSDFRGQMTWADEEWIEDRQVRTVAAGPRLAHFIIDSICFQIMMVIIQFVCDVILKYTASSWFANRSLELVFTILLIVLYPLLYAICEYAWQQTPGKMLTGTKVIDEYGNRPSFGTLMLRSICRFVPFEPFSCFGSPSWGWHDRWSKTFVVPISELAELKRLQLAGNEGIQ